MTHPWRSFCGKSPATAGTRPCGTHASCHRPAAAARPLMTPGAPCWSTPTQSRYISHYIWSLSFLTIPAPQQALVNAPDGLDLLDSLLISVQESCNCLVQLHPQTYASDAKYCIPGDHEAVKQVNVQFLKALLHNWENKRNWVHCRRRWEM